MTNKRSVVVYGTINRGVLNFTLNPLPFLAKKITIKSFSIDCTQDTGIDLDLKSSIGILTCSFLPDPLLLFRFKTLSFGLPDVVYTTEIGDSFNPNIEISLPTPECFYGTQRLYIQAVGASVASLTVLSTIALILEFSD